MPFSPIEELHRVTYHENVQLAVQQRASVFKDAFTFHPDLKGKQAQVVENVGRTEADVDAPRGAETPNKSRMLEDIWMRPRHVYWGRTHEKEDDIKKIVDYSSFDVQETAAAFGRKEDEIYVSALFGDRLVGNEAPSAVAWAGKTVPVNYSGTSEPLTRRKLGAAIRQLQKAWVMVEREELFCALTGYQIEQIWNDLENLPGDGQRVDLPVMRRRVQMEYRNVRFIHTEALPVPAAGQVSCALWAKRGMHRGEFSPLDTNVDRDPTRMFRPRTFSEEWIGATRSEDELVVKINCLEAAD